MQINGISPALPRTFQEGLSPVWKKIAEAIAVITIAIFATLLAGWAGLIATVLIYGAIKACALTPLPPQHRQQDPVEKTFNLEELLQNPPHFSNQNKAHAYQVLTAGRDLTEESITIRKTTLSNPPDREHLFNRPKTQVQLFEGTFPYPVGEHHWTANFGDPHLFFGCEGPLLAQDELQVLEFPALSHLHRAILNTPFARLDTMGSCLLIEGAKRHGHLDTSREFPGFGNLYGNRFRAASFQQIDEALARFEIPLNSKLFVFCAPNISPDLEGQPYRYEHLHHLFINAYAAFKGIQEKDPNAVIHTGNWGCGAFGNSVAAQALMQIAAARLAGIKRIHYYPLLQAAEFNAAEQLFDQIERENPRMTVDGFLRYVEAHAAEFGLLYGRGNGT